MIRKVDFVKKIRNQRNRELQRARANNSISHEMLVPLLFPLVAIFVPARSLSPSIEAVHRLRGGFAAAAVTSSYAPLRHSATPLCTLAATQMRVARVPRARQRSTTPLLSLRGGVFSLASSALAPLGTARAARRKWAVLQPP